MLVKSEPSFYLDATSLSASNWTRFINDPWPSPDANVEFRQNDLTIEVWTLTDISAGTELLAHYMTARQKRCLAGKTPPTKRKKLVTHVARVRDESVAETGSSSEGGDDGPSNAALVKVFEQLRESQERMVSDISSSFRSSLAEMEEKNRALEARHKQLEEKTKLSEERQQQTLAAMEERLLTALARCQPPPPSAPPTSQPSRSSSQVPALHFHMQARAAPPVFAAAAAASPFSVYTPQVQQQQQQQQQIFRPPQVQQPPLDNGTMALLSRFFQQQ
jgi:hypothetical protein